VELVTVLKRYGLGAILHNFGVSVLCVYCDAKEKGTLSRTTSGYLSVPESAEAVAPSRPDFLVKLKIEKGKK
jgi:hypothetical protein